MLPGPSHGETRNRILILLLCLIGVISVGYGMIMDSDGIFVLGIVCVVSGYFLIRRRLKASLRDESDN